LACPEWSLKEAMKAACRYGYDGVELRVLKGSVDLLAQSELRGDGLGESAARLQDAGVAVPCIGTGACLHWPDAGRRRQEMEVVLQHVEMAQALSCPALRVFGDRIQAGTEREETERWITEGMEELQRRMRGAGVQVLLETHGDFASREQLRFLSGGCGLIWDPANAFAQEEETPAISQEMETRIQHVHVKDMQRRDGSYAHVLPGEGDFPLRTMLKELRRIRYQGFVSFEWERHWHPELAPAEVALPFFVEWWTREERA
jgi:sugar phosphate isomerase/epimerase